MLHCHDAFYGYPFEGYWAYCGTVEEYWQANMDLLDEPSALEMWKWNIRTNLDDRNVAGHQPALFFPTANVRQSIISSGCRISGTVEQSVLSPGVTVEEGAVIRHSIIFHESTIKAGAVLDRVISDKDVVVGEQSSIGTDDGLLASEALWKGYAGITILGKEANIGKHVRVVRNVLIYPGVAVQDNREIASARVVR